MRFKSSSSGPDSVTISRETLADLGAYIAGLQGWIVGASVCLEDGQ